MSSDTLRRAAALMRERAQAATAGPWSTECIGSEGWAVFGPRGLDERWPQRRPRTAAVTWGSFESDKADAAHIASWHPAVALAVADWLERVSRDSYCASPGEVRSARAIARAYLGESA